MRVSILGILGSFLCLAFTLRVAAQSHEGQQKPFAFRHSNNAHATKHIITPEFSRFVEDLLEIANIPGLTLGIVHTDREAERLVELDAWGRKTEEGFGHDMSPDVSIPSKIPRTSISRQHQSRRCLRLPRAPRHSWRLPLDSSWMTMQTGGM